MPSIANGLFSGRAGIQSHGIAIAVLADNISNSNTTGFKASRAEFTDLLSGNLGGGGGIAVGSGSSVNNVLQVFTQGTFENTGRGLDAAIDGTGFFIVEDNGARFYSRAGNFTVDTEGNLLNQNGLNVLGFPATGAGGLQKLNLASLPTTATPTTSLSISANLDATASPFQGPPGVVTFANLNTNAAFSTFTDVYDSLGGTHSLTHYFFHTASGAWTAQTYIDGGEIQGGTAGAAVLLGQTNLTFNSSGQLTSANNYNLAAQTMANGSTLSAIATTLTPITQFATSSSVKSVIQNGVGVGTVTTFNIEKDGTLFALLDNGQTASVGKIALAAFSNVEGLKRTGNSLYSQSNTSGEPVIGQPDTGQFGALQAGSLELSTSDLASDFIKLISFQRGFQGSSRIITSIDDLLNEVVNLAR